MRKLSVMVAMVVATLAAGTANAAVRRDARRPALAAVCRGEALPFPVPSGDDMEAWTDSDYERWVMEAWEDYCEAADRTTRQGSYERRACACTAD